MSSPFCDVIERRECETFKPPTLVISRHVGGLLSDVSWQPFVSGIPLRWGGSIFLGESQSGAYPNMCAKFGCRKKGGGTDRQTKGHCSFI